MLETSTRRGKRRKRGTTLVELVSATCIFSLLFAITMVVLRSGQEQLFYAETRMNLEESLRKGLHELGLEVREASASRTNIGNSGATLTIQIPSAVSNSANITWSNALTYQVGGTGRQLVRLDAGTRQTTVLANDIQSVNFAATGNPVTSIQYTVTARRTLWNGRNITVASTGEARLRNG